jgi:transcriptional regulator with XRE-family HTH domain
VQVQSYNFAIGPYNPGMQTGRPAKSKRSEFGARLHALRETAGLSQAQVAEKLDITQPSYAAWERRTVALSHVQLQQLAEIFGVKIEEFFRSDEPAGKRGGPTGRAKRAFEVVSKLPRTQQQKILDVVEALVTQAKAS